MSRLRHIYSWVFGVHRGGSCALTGAGLQRALHLGLPRSGLRRQQLLGGAAVALQVEHGNLAGALVAQGRQRAALASGRTRRRLQPKAQRAASHLRLVERDGDAEGCVDRAIPAGRFEGPWVHHRPCAEPGLLDGALAARLCMINDQGAVGCVGAGGRTKEGAQGRSLRD